MASLTDPLSRKKAAAWANLFNINQEKHFKSYSEKNRQGYEIPREPSLSLTVVHRLLVSASQRCGHVDDCQENGRSRDTVVGPIVPRRRSEKDISRVACYLGELVGGP